jgi:hypothetical protein
VGAALNAGLFIVSIDHSTNKRVLCGSKKLDVGRFAFAATKDSANEARNARPHSCALPDEQVRHAAEHEDGRDCPQHDDRHGCSPLNEVPDSLSIRDVAKERRSSRSCSEAIREIDAALRADDEQLSESRIAPPAWLAS